MSAVSVRNLCKSYAGTVAVRDLTFSVEPGELLGLIGPNGAGKSSTIKIILDFMRPDSGEVNVFGRPMCEESKNRIGYLPEERGLYKKLTAIDQIVYLASLRGMGQARAKQRAEILLEQTGMLGSRDTKIKKMSKGMGQIIQFIVTIVHDPQLIILDEPFSGLDPVNTETIKKIVASLRDQGRAIILSTHQMNQVEEMADRILMIDHGSEVLHGRLREIRTRFRKHSILVDAEGELGELPGVLDRNIGKDVVELELAPDASPQDILDHLRSRGIPINRFEISSPTLNQIFLSLARGDS